MSRWWAMVWARSLEFLRDRSALGWNIAFPLLVVAGMGFAFSGPGQPLFKVAVLADRPLEELSQAFLKTEQTRFYREDNADEAMGKVGRERVDMLLDLRTAPARYWINPQSMKGKLLEKLLLASGLPAQAQALTGVGVRYVDWLAPGVLGMNMMFSCLFGVGYVIVRYRKSGYLKRLNATPLRAFEFIAAQLFSRLVLVMLIVSVVFFGCNLMIHFRMEGSYVDLFVLTLVAAISMLSLGLVIAARVTSEELAGGILNLMSWPMMVVSGVFFSLDGAPPILRKIAQAFPLTHLNDAARAIMLDGATLSQVAPDLGVLAAMAAVFLTLGALSFRWTQD